MRGFRVLSAAALAAAAMLVQGGVAGAATFVVDSTSDTAPAGDSIPGDGICEDLRSGSRCTLRAAIEEANAQAGFDEIQFAVSGTIVLNMPLPAITRPVNINGRSAPGYSNGSSLASSPPAITLDGSLLGSSAAGLHFQGSGAAISDVHALSIVNFGFAGIQTSAGARALLAQRNWIGLRPDGSVAGNGTGMRLASDDNLVGLPSTVGLGNVVSGNEGIGMFLVGDGNVVRGNVVGLLASGSGDRGNGTSGIRVQGNDNHIGDGSTESANLVSFNGSHGIELRGDGNRIAGNLVGLAGISTAGNGGIGIAVSGDDNVIGGPAPGDRNRVHGSLQSNIAIGSLAAVAGNRNLVQNNTARSAAGYGIWIVDGSGNQVLDNEIGDNGDIGIQLESGSADTSVAGNRLGYVLGGGGEVFQSPNGGRGISVAGSGARIGIDTSGGGAAVRGNTIGFSGDEGIAVVAGNGHRIAGNFVGITHAGDRIGNAGSGIGVYSGASNVLLSTNYIGANAFSGVVVDAGGTLLCGNYVGTNVSFADLGNGIHGIWLRSDGNRVGEGCSGNVIGFNAASGVRVSGNGNLIHDNFIGASPAGTAMGNGGNGVLIVQDGAQDNAVADNVLAHNAGAGVRVAENAGNGNLVEYNRFFGNGGVGVDLGPAGPTANDADDADIGPNRLQNHPDIAFANLGTDEVVVTWSVDTSATNAAYPLMVDFYLGDGSGTRQGAEFLSRYLYDVPFALVVAGVPLPAGATGGDLLAVTVDADGNTSEFSAPVAFGAPQALFSDGFESP